MNGLFLFMLTICLSIALVLVFHKDYDDGVIGKIALGMVIIASGGVIFDSMQGVEYEPLNVTLLFLAGVTLFLIRFTYRWLRWRASGRRKFDWGPPQGRERRARTHCRLDEIQNALKGWEKK